MNENIENFKREMKRGIRGIDTLVYMLEGGLKSLSGRTISDLLLQYPFADIIKKAFDDLAETAGNETVSYSKTATVDFLEQCFGNK